MFRVTNVWPQFGHVHKGRLVWRPGGRTGPSVELPGDQDPALLRKGP